jgi:hypothetical protein
VLIIEPVRRKSTSDPLARCPKRAAQAKLGMAGVRYSKGPAQTMGRMLGRCKFYEVLSGKKGVFFGEAITGCRHFLHNFLSGNQMALRKAELA